MKYCIVCVITANDTANQVRDLFGLGAGQTGLKDYIIEDPLTPERWVLAQGGSAISTGNDKNGNPLRVDGFVLIAYVRDVPDTIRTRIGQALNARPGIGAQVDLPVGTTRQQILDRLTKLVGNTYACDHYWRTKPGDDVTTGINSPETLLAKFSPVPGV